MVRIPKMLAGLLLSSELLVVLAVGFTVHTEARIRATVAAGETIASAINSYIREQGEAPARLEALVPHYLRSIPQPVYGATQWEYSRASSSSQRSDERLSIDIAFASHPAKDLAATAFTLAVRVDPAPFESRFRRRVDGCWQLPEMPQCW